uniref:Aminoacyl-transfer RNA synthetases class-II family profile domain-containing protein n=1 Tax=Glossina austeni TaxID=7395 RepID=A0A1A9UKE3_GLOAU
MVTVDHGISSFQGVELARKKGMIIIITDHHLPHNKLPNAHAIINPHLKNCKFNSKCLSGSGVAFYLMLALRNTLIQNNWFKINRTKPPKLAEFLDLVALGTISDYVPLDLNNRILVYQGLKRIRSKKCRPGFVLYHRDWHEGILGIIAARIKEYFYCTTVVFAKIKTNLLKGSVRSIAEINIKNILYELSKLHPQLIISFGGHKTAAGLIIKHDNLDKFKENFLKLMESKLIGLSLTKIFWSDGELCPHECSLGTAMLILNSAPWGSEFPYPVFDGKFYILNQIIIAIQEKDTNTLLEIEKDIHILKKEIKETALMCIFSKKHDTENCYIDLQPGSGGVDAQDWAQILLRMYLKWADRQKFKIKIIDKSDAEIAGIKSATIKIFGKYAYDIRIDVYRASGAGGQHVNRTESAVRITHLPTNISTQCQNGRSQHKNKEQAIKQLKSKLYNLEMTKKNANKKILEQSKAKIAWGNQIRSYVFDSSRIKDLRSGIVSNQVQSILDGNLDIFIKIETPMMHKISGGGLAKPFITHHNTLNMNLYLRIAPELYLKQLIVGGFEKIFEINRNFRNEGISANHNPEFTMMEFYVAYINYQDMMKIVENLLSAIVKKFFNKYVIKYNNLFLNFTPPFDKISMQDSICKYYSDIKSEDLNDLNKITQIAKKFNIHISNTWGIGKLQETIFSEIVQNRLIQPTFIFDYPTEISPLAKCKNNNKFLTERFELFINGNEIGNGFSELNDPKEQKIRFLQQKENKKLGENLFMQYDSDYLLSLDYGLPPTAGCGIGIDRLIMLLTNNIKILMSKIFLDLLKEELLLE